MGALAPELGGDGLGGDSGVAHLVAVKEAFGEVGEMGGVGKEFVICLRRLVGEMDGEEVITGDKRRAGVEIGSVAVNEGQGSEGTTDRVD